MVEKDRRKKKSLNRDQETLYEEDVAQSGLRVLRSRTGFTEGGSKK